MFSFLRKKSLAKRAALMGAVLVLLTGFLFISCDEPDPDPITPPPGIDVSFLHGTWYSTNSGYDFFIIDNTAKTLEYASGWGSGTYTGKILDIEKKTSAAETIGVIYIKFTEKPEDYNTGLPVTGDYTGIYFKLTKPSVNYGFYLPVDEDYSPVTTSTLAEAKTTCSLAKFDDYVLFDIEYAKIAGGNGGVHSSPLEGKWVDEYDTIFTITKTTIVSAMDMGGYAYPFFAGDIFKVVNKSSTEGYIVFRYVSVDDPELLGKYSVLYYKSLGNNSVKMAIAGEDYYGNDSTAVESTVTEAETKYKSGNTDDFDFTDFSK
jgi:hypothetical protein